MDESLQELENELKRLSPRSPSAQLLSAIEAGLAAKRERTSFAGRATREGELIRWPWFNWRTTAVAAAALAFAAVWLTARRSLPSAPENVTSQPVAVTGVSALTDNVAAPSPTVLTVKPAPERYRPVGAASVLYDLREDGTASRTNSSSVRRLRYRYVDTYTWENPATHASLKWSLPRDEVRVLPASLR